MQAGQGWGPFDVTMSSLLAEYAMRSWNIYIIRKTGFSPLEDQAHRTMRGAL